MQKEPSRFRADPVSIGNRSPAYDRSAWHRWLWAAWLAVPFVSILFTGILVAWLNDGRFGRTAYWSVQRDWFIALNNLLADFPAKLWSNLSLVGDAWVLFALSSMLIVWRPQAWAAMLGAVPMAGALSVIGKHLAAVPRPASVLESADFVTIGARLSGHNSLPSGHSITVFAAMIAVLATLFPRPRTLGEQGLIVAGILIASGLCLSRVAVGAHWPLDLLVGSAIGWIAGLSGAALARRHDRWWRWSMAPSGHYILGAITLLWSSVTTYRALQTPSHDLVLWLAALSALVTALWLLSTAPKNPQLDMSGPAT